MTDKGSRVALGAIVATLILTVAIIVFFAVMDAVPNTGITARGSANSPTSSKSTTDATPSDSGENAPSEASATDPSSEKSGTGAADERTSSEVLPAPDEKSPIGLPPSPPLPGLVTAPLPPTATATGTLVAGFPASVIPLNPGTTVQSSSVASAEDRLQATLAATTSSTSDAVLEFYRVAFAAQSLVDSVAPAAGESVALLFSRGADTILLTVTPTDSGGSTYSVFGAFTAAT
jgi:hypothetical protein